VDENEANFHKFCAQYGSLTSRSLRSAYLSELWPFTDFLYPALVTWEALEVNTHKMNIKKIKIPWKANFFQFSPFYWHVTWCTSNLRRFTLLIQNLWISCNCYILFIKKQQVKINEFFRRVRKIAKATVGFIMYIRPHGTTRLPMDGFSWNLLFEYLFENLSRKSKLHYNLTRITGTRLMCIYDISLNTS